VKLTDDDFCLIAALVIVTVCVGYGFFVFTLVRLLLLLGNYVSVVTTLS
jgi:hypothetical protein